MSSRRPDGPPRSKRRNRLPFISFLLLSAWCGLVAGLLEVGAVIVRKHTFDPNHLYGMTRHFVWLIPVTDICIFLVAGSVGWIVGWAWPRRGRWLFMRALCTLTLLPMLLVAFPTIYSAALGWVALGSRGEARAAARTEPSGISPVRPVQFPAAVVLVMSWERRYGLAIGSSTRAAARPLPPPGRRMFC